MTSLHLLLIDPRVTRINQPEMPQGAHLLITTKTGDIYTTVGNILTADLSTGFGNGSIRITGGGRLPTSTADIL